MSGTWALADHCLFPAETPDADSILFGAADASLFAIDRRTQHVLERWRRRAPFALEQAPPGEREILAALRDARVLVPADAPRGPQPRALDASAIPLGTLVLEAAQACNLRCGYCYAGGGSYGGPSRLMSAELARRAGRFLVESSGDRLSVTLVLFGGEPLLNLPALEAAVAEAEAAAAARGKRLVVSLTTNGTRFGDQALAFIAAHGIAVSVSIDGPPDVHDANRPHSGPSGRGSYDDVVAGLARLTARTRRPPAARVTLMPEQWDRVPEVFDHVASLGVLEVGIAPASPITPKLLPAAAQESSLLAGFAALAERFAADARAGRVLPFSNLLDLLARLHEGRVKDVPCGAGLGYLAMDAEGGLYLCHRFAGDAHFQVGHIDRGVDYAKIERRLEEQAAPRRDDCAACWARSLCAGGCHYENHLRESTLGLAPGGSCDFIRRWLELGIRVYAELMRDPAHPVLALLERRVDI